MSDTDTLTTPTTADVLAGMFTENTGRALCDSGDAYGRNFERNAGRDVQSFLDAPAAFFDRYSGPVLDLFHFLNDRLDFDAELQAEFDAYAEERPDDYWPEIMEGFAAEREWAHFLVNVANHENALSQVIQYVQADTEGGDACYGDVVILQVHGGADIRGGYTAPKVFRTCGEVGLLDDSDVDIWCTGSTVVAPQTETLPEFPDTPPVEIQHSWYSDDAGYHWYSDGETPDYSGLSYGSDDPELEYNDDGHPICPIPECTGTLHASGRYV